LILLSVEYCTNGLHDHGLDDAGVLAGCGWQKIGAYVNLGSFYVVGVPCAVVLAFFVHMHAMVILYSKYSDKYVIPYLSGLCFVFILLQLLTCTLFCQIIGTVVRDHLCIYCANFTLQYFYHSF